MLIKIRHQAKLKGFSLYKLAKEMKLPQQTVYSWASARTQPGYENMERLCKVLDCEIGDLLEKNGNELAIPLLTQEEYDSGLKNEQKRMENIRERAKSLGLDLESCLISTDTISV